MERRAIEVEGLKRRPPTEVGGLGLEFRVRRLVKDVSLALHRTWKTSSRQGRPCIRPARHPVASGGDSVVRDGAEQI